MDSSKDRIGFVGVGRMGANMARHLKDEGMMISALFDSESSRAKDLGSELNCMVAATPAQVAEQSDIVLTVVTDDQAMRDIFATGETSSLLNHAQGRVFINCATVTPDIHVEIQDRVEKAGGQSLEACMASSITQAREGTLYLMCAGRREVFSRVEPILNSLSAKLRYIGEAGQAAKVKALVNMVMNINTAGLAEGLGLGKALGLDLAVLQEVFSQTGAASRVLETDGDDMVQRDHACFFSAAHAAKDSGIAVQMAKALGQSLPLAESTLAQYERLVRVGKGELDKSGVAELTFPDRS